MAIYAFNRLSELCASGRAEVVQAHLLPAGWLALSILHPVPPQLSPSLTYSFKNYNMLIFVSIILVVAATDNLAILVSSSVGYYNYRQGANLLTVYQHLKANGFSDQDIILMMPENPGCCDKNPIPGSVSFIDGDYTNINVDLVLDRRYSEFNLKELYDVLRGKYDP